MPAMFLGIDMEWHPEGESLGVDGKYHPDNYIYGVDEKYNHPSLFYRPGTNKEGVYVTIGQIAAHLG